MPTVSVNRDLLFASIKKTFTDQQFDDLCFHYGIELDEITSERQLMEKEHATSTTGIASASKQGLSDEVIYKLEVAANRYDMLSVEGISRTIGIFLGTLPIPEYKVISPVESLTVTRNVHGIRPYGIAAILRNITFTQASYDSFIDLQDKLHSGIGRRRQIVSMGTHDLDTVQGPFTYDALPPERILFKPLNQKQVVDGHGMVRLYEQDVKIKKFLPLIRDSPLFPVILDAKGTVMSVPPLINSDHSKITLGTRNVFIDITATDLEKAKIALNTLLTDFVQHCQPREGGLSVGIEAVSIRYPQHHDGDGDEGVKENSTASCNIPDLGERTMDLDIKYVNTSLGLSLDARAICDLLQRMALQAVPVEGGLRVRIPATRSDILHPCDLMEDVAIAYGFNNLPTHIPSTSCFAAPFPLNKLSDLLRREVALVGFTEVLTLSLCSKEENFAWLRLKDDSSAVVLANPKTVEYEVVQTSLIPQMIKTLGGNKAMPLPLRLFQLADVALWTRARTRGPGISAASAPCLPIRVGPGSRSSMACWTA